MRRILTAATLAMAGCAVLDSVAPIGDGAFMAVVHTNDVDAPVAGAGVLRAAACALGGHQDRRAWPLRRIGAAAMASSA